MATATAATTGACELLGSIRPVSTSKAARPVQAEPSLDEACHASLLAASGLAWPAPTIPPYLGGSEISLPEIPLETEVSEASQGPSSIGVRMHRQSFATWLDDSPPDSPGGAGGDSSPPGVPKDQQYLFAHLRQSSSLRSRSE